MNVASGTLHSAGTSGMATVPPYIEHDHTAHRRQRRALIIGGLCLAGIILAPHLLPALHIGLSAAPTAFADCFPLPSIDPLTGLATSGIAGDGMAAWAANALSHVPLIGAELAKGGWMNALVSGAVGLGGVLLGGYLEQREDGTTGFQWGKLIRNVALATSLFVTIPALFPAVSMGLVFLGATLLPFAGPGLTTFFTSTLGTLATSTSPTFGLGTAGFVLPHLATCGLTLGSTAAAVGGHHVASAPVSFQQREATRTAAPMPRGIH